MSEHYIWVAMSKDRYNENVVYAFGDEPTITKEGFFRDYGVYVCRAEVKRLGLSKILKPGYKAKFELRHIETWHEEYVEGGKGER